MVTKRLHEGELNEIVNFNDRDQSCLVTQFCMGAILKKMAVLKNGNYSLSILPSGVEGLT